MANLVWAGGSGSWADPAQWDGGVAPGPDDSDSIAAGTVVLAAGSSLDAQAVTLLGAATFVAADATLGNRFTLDTASTSDATFAVQGSVGTSGTLAVGAGTLDLATTADAEAAGDLLLLDGAQVSIAAGGTLALSGMLTNFATVTVADGGTFLNDGTIAQAHAAFEVESGGTLTGGGSFAIGLFSSLYLQPGAAASGQDVTFTDVGGRLLLGDPATYSGTIEGFRLGDLIDLTTTVADSASYDAAAGLLVVQDAGATVAALHMQGAPGGPLVATGDGSGGTVIEVAGTAPRTSYTITGADRAMQANVVRDTMTTPSGVPITGAGVKVGIISNSFDSAPGTGSLDVANAAALAGYLPLNTAGTGSGVTVLGDAVGSGDDNEGLAMAEEVHQVAPGAALYFDTAEGGTGSFAGAVAALQQAGCQVIVDDVSYLNEPFFQNAGPIDAAIEAAVAAGVSYFTAAGNEAGAAYAGSYAPAVCTLPDGAPAVANIFAGGADTQTLTLIGGETTEIALQWAAPYQAGGAGGALSMTLFDAAGTQVATSTQDPTAPEAVLTVSPGSTTQYRLAITGPLAAGTPFKYVLFGGAGGGSGPGGTIDDPAADNAGTVIGHAMLANVNTIGAIDYADTPAFGVTAAYPAYYSALGPAQFLFDPSGATLAAPQTVTKPDLLAPEGEATSVAGFAPFGGTSAASANAAGVAALMLQADPALTPAQVSAMLQQSALDLGLPQDVQGAGLIQAPGAVTLALDAAAGVSAAACFAEGTAIATVRGPVAVERLRRGMRVRLAGGGTAPVIWTGHRRMNCADHPRPADVRPVRLAAHAIAPDRPARDLLLSPDHAVLLAGVLIPVRYLLNGATIVQVPAGGITYWHVELPAHAALLAENLPAESYLDTGNRGAFDGEAGGGAVEPERAWRRWRRGACAPLVTGGPLLAAVRAALLARAQHLGHTLAEAPALGILADGHCLRPLGTDRRVRCRLPPHTRAVRLRSRVFVPAEVTAAHPDTRRLGVAVAGLCLDGERLALDDRRLLAGWHAPEDGWRWTGGDALLAVAGARILSFDLAITGRYWQEG
jgi:hypothetical protein